MVWVLAQSDTTSDYSWTGFYAALGIAVMLALGMVILIFVRKKSEAMDAEFRSPLLPFSLHDLRRMHEDGELTDEEFEKARQKIVEMSKSLLDKPRDKPPEGNKPYPGEDSRPPVGESDKNHG